MKQSRAAEIWASLEKRLIERCGLPNGRMLEVNRPYLIRWIGERLKGVPVEVMAAAGDTVSPPLRLDDSELALIFKSTEVVGQKSAQSAQSAMRTMRIDADTIHDLKLAAYLDRACSLRGYDADDSVGYS